jgi:ATP-dependent Clp protease ATP-binding subunit ClpC
VHLVDEDHVSIAELRQFLRDLEGAVDGAGRVEAQLANKDMVIELTPAAKSLLARRGFDPVLGARPLRRTIQREIEDQLSEKILFGEIEGGQIVIVDVEGVNPEVAEGSRAADDKARFTFRGEP